jgi:hypothetical protein
MAAAAGARAEARGGFERLAHRMTPARCVPNRERERRRVRERIAAEVEAAAAQSLENRRTVARRIAPKRPLEQHVIPGLPEERFVGREAQREALRHREPAVGVGAGEADHVASREELVPALERFGHRTAGGEERVVGVEAIACGRQQQARARAAGVAVRVQELEPPRPG